jgi:hypothetical protein
MSSAIASDLLGVAPCVLEQPFLEWRQIPTLTVTAHDPEPPLSRVVGEAAADRKMLGRFIPTEIAVRKQARGVHRTL